jgi:hypothetical protein
VLAFQALEQGIESLRGLHERALGRQPGEKVEHAMRFRRRPAGCQDRVEQMRGTPAGFRHVNVRIGPVRDQAVAMLDHRPRDVGMEIEARDDRHARTDQAAYACQQLALTVIEMLGDHCSVQIEIDAVDRPEAGEPRQHLADDVLVGIAGDVRRGRSRAPDQARTPVSE